MIFINVATSHSLVVIDHQKSIFTFSSSIRTSTTAGCWKVWTSKPRTRKSRPKLKKIDLLPFPVLGHVVEHVVLEEEEVWGAENKISSTSQHFKNCSTQFVRTVWYSSVPHSTVGMRIPDMPGILMVQFVPIFIIPTVLHKSEEHFSLVLLANWFAENNVDDTEMIFWTFLSFFYVLTCFD